MTALQQTKLANLLEIASQLDDELFKLCENDKMDEAIKLAKEMDEATNNRFDFMESLNY